MKKFCLISLILAVLLVFCACAKPDEAPIDPAVDETDGDDVITRTQIGFSLAGSGVFYDQFKTDIEQACEGLDYQANIVFADSGDKQQRDIRSMLSAGVEVIVIDPVDVDVLESVLAECETLNVPVINIIDSINGRVDTLVSPDYLAIGKKAAQQAVSLFPDGGAQCLELKTYYDSFVMQLMSDGFSEIVNANSNINLVAESYCGIDEEAAYTAAKDAISQKGVNIIFAQNAALARGAIRAVEEAGKQIYLVTIGGDMELVKEVQAGKINATIFFGTKQLADMVVSVADEYIKSSTYVAALYIVLKTDMITAENAADYASDSLLYAQIKADTQ